MSKKIKIPFTTDNIENKETFKLLNENKIKSKMNNKKSLLNSIKNIIFSNNSSNNSLSNNINYIKASKTKEYYKKLK
jgi:hypothetical protein